MTVKDCTKEELLLIISRLSFGSNKHILDRALSDIKFQREQRNIDESHRLFKEGVEELKAYHATLEPYQGKSVGSIPQDIVDKALQHFDNYKRLTAKSEQLMKGGK